MNGTFTSNTGVIGKLIVPSRVDTVYSGEKQFDKSYMKFAESIQTEGEVPSTLAGQGKVMVSRRGSGTSIGTGTLITSGGWKFFKK